MSAVTASRVAAPMSAPPLRLIIGLGGLYVGQSVIGGVIFTGLPAVMRQNGASLNDIALILLTVLPWSFKFLWAPALERFREARAGQEEIRLGAMTGDYLPRASVHDFLGLLASILREASQLLQRQYGEAPYLIIADALDEIDRHIDEQTRSAQTTET